MDIQEVRDYLDQKRGNWPKIAKDTGVNYWWILRFMSNGKKRIVTPGFDKIKKLSDYMNTS